MFKQITTTADEVFIRNKMRKSFVLQNEDTTNNLFIKQERAATPTVSATDHDHRLGPGASMALNYQNDGEEAIQDRWTAVASAGTINVSFFETETIERD